METGSRFQQHSLGRDRTHNLMVGSRGHYIPQDQCCSHTHTHTHTHTPHTHPHPYLLEASMHVLDFLLNEAGQLVAPFPLHALHLITALHTLVHRLQLNTCRWESAESARNTPNNGQLTEILFHELVWAAGSLWRVQGIEGRSKGFVWGPSLTCTPSPPFTCTSKEQDGEGYMC